MAEETRREIQIPVVWDKAEDVAIIFANQFVGQVGQQDEVVLTFGQVTPPVLLGPREQQEAQVREIPFVPVKPVARLGLTKAGLDDLIRVLNETRDNYDKAQEAVAKRAEESDEE